MIKNMRRLKVYYGHHGNASKRHPYIRLAGAYLTQFDFKIGDKIEVIMNEGSIVISKVPVKEAGDSA